MIRVVVDDLAFVPSDAVVRPATASLEPTTPALRRLEQVGGPAFHAHLHVQSDLDIGAAVVTGGGDLAAEFVIHAVIRSADQPVTAGGVRRALVSVLQRAADWQLGSLTLPPLGTGAGNLSVEDAARIMVDVLAEAQRQGATYPHDVCIVVESDDERELFETCLRSQLNA